MESELPPAVGLILKLASESATARSPAACAVRSCLRASPGGVSAGTLDALRLAVQQSDAIATALLADIDVQCRAGRGPLSDAQVRTVVSDLSSIVVARWGGWLSLRHEKCQESTEGDG